MSTTPTLERVSTDQLRHGDVVHDAGMILVIDQDITNWPAGHGRTTYATNALIRNWPEIVANADVERADRIANGGNRFIVSQARADADGAHRWVIQGNELAHWYRETRTA